jgi:hypothetical protein
VISKTTIRFFGYILLLLRRFLLFWLLIYWVAFISYTIAKYIEGGLDKVATYYWYVACENRLGPCPRNWGAFWFAQGVYLAITLLLCFFEWRSWKTGTPTGESIRG